MQLGEKYKVITESSLCDAKNVRRPLCGRVVYVHPLGRFAVLEFTGIRGNFRESYFPEERHSYRPAVAADSFGATAEPMARIREVIV